MYENLDVFRRWNADHKASIIIEKNDDMEESLKVDLRDSGFKFLATDKKVADLFGVELFQGCLCTIAENSAFKKDVFAFALGFDEEDGFELAYSCFDLEDSAFVGLFLVEKQAWLNAYPAYDFGEDYVYDMILETLVAKAQQAHQGLCYEAQIDEFGDGESFCSREGYASPEDALEDAMDEFPEIEFEDGDFELVDGQFKLKLN